MTILAIVIIVLVLFYLIIRFNSLWVYRFFDRSLVNNRDSLSKEYELPRYFKLDKHGEVDTGVRWPGWDGWYFFMVPEDRNIPVKMIRASIMTGLYGLEGIDSYEKLLLRLSTFEAVEHLTLIPTEEEINGKEERENNLSHNYMTKKTDLNIDHKKLDVSITGVKAKSDNEMELYGRITGAWPNYEFQFTNPESDISLTFHYNGESIIWWADVPEFFTYFAAFGKLYGKITYKRRTRRSDIHKLTDKEETYSINGRGCFEHGFARKPFDFDRFWLPIVWLENLFPSLKPIRYHYELFIGDNNHQGGFIHARGFGIDFRNRGGVYINGAYREIKSVRIKYLDDPETDIVDAECRGKPSVRLYKRWHVRAVMDDGIFEYTGKREWPPASISSNMIYYNFSYEGTYKGQTISGRGYGEYAHI
ncbi:MAG: hypothetical protein C4291_00465 [Candidatus Dadabacteria bacterium]